MLESLKKLQEKIDARIIRERALIFLTAIAIIFMLWNFLIQSSIDKNTADTKSQLDALVVQRTTMQTQITASTQNLLNDPDKQKKEQISQLQSDISALDTQLQNVSQNLIKADQLPQALQEVLQKTQQLTLLEVNTLPAQELHFVAVGENNSQPSEENKAGVYQHVVELRVSGSFSQVVQLLNALENLPWRFYWQSLDYKVDHYPNGEVLLKVYTLSSEEGLFGV
ncbi:MAG: MSHA biogenesis protein MshJ [Gammaproteobacteria bacterium]|nr:MAG: MSHA biogenesis protein MshJ [Gammaproteobacteria bacterium]